MRRVVALLLLSLVAACGPSHSEKLAAALDEAVSAARQGDVSRALSLVEVWRRRELLYFFAWRDLKIRYKQTVIGAAWVMLQPLLIMIVFTIFFGRVVGVSADGLPYPVFVYAGLLPWNYYNLAMTESSIRSRKNCISSGCCSSTSRKTRLRNRSASSMLSANSKNAISGSIIQNSAKCRLVLEFSARNVGPNV